MLYPNPGQALIVAGIVVDQANEGGWHYPSPSLPALALSGPRASPSPGPASRPKLTLSSLSAPSSSSSPRPPPTALPPVTSRPYLVSNPSSGSRSVSTPTLKLAIPAGGGGGPAFTSQPEYRPDSASGDDDDSLNSSLKTPMANATDMTIRAGSDYDEESSYGYGRINNGSNDSTDALRAMTTEIRQTLSRSRFESPNPSYVNLPTSARTVSSGSRSSSRASSAAGELDSRRGSMVANEPGVAKAMAGMSLSEPAPMPSGVDHMFDPTKLVRIRRLGEGAGGAVELVQDPQTGWIMAKKVGTRSRQGLHLGHCEDREPPTTSSAGPRVTLPQLLLLTLHRRALRLFPRRAGQSNRYSDGVLRRRQSRRIDSKDEGERHEVF